MGQKTDFDLARFFLALSDKTRLRLLNLMGEDEVCVCFFVEALAELQPKISRHLATLRDAGIVTTRRDGKWMHYRIAKPDYPPAARVLEEVLASFKENTEMQKDRVRLQKVCCARSPPVQLRAAPKPASLL